MQTRAISRAEHMNYIFHQFVSDYAGAGIFATLLLTIPVTLQDLSVLVPIASAILVLFGQGVRWYRDDKRKQERHDLFVKIGEKMMAGEIPFNEKFMERLSDNAD